MAKIDLYKVSQKDGYVLVSDMVRSGAKFLGEQYLIKFSEFYPYKDLANHI